jgi:hypothetical protein
MSQTTAAKLERRARALLRAYPAGYRRDRGEEIIDTLLEATPGGLAYPSARDSRALIAGGLHARAARNRAPGTAASLRLALLLGTAMFLSVSIDFFVVMPLAGPGPAAHPWLAAAGCALSTAAGLAPWLWSRAVTVALVISAGALLAVGLGAANGGSLSRGDVLWFAWILVAMGALVALSGGPQRLPGSWLWLLAVAPAATAAARLIPSAADAHLFPSAADVYMMASAALLLVAVVTCWLVTDARPAFGLSIAVLLVILQYDTTILLPGPGLTAQEFLLLALLPLAVSLAIALAVMRLLYRHAAPAPRPLP